MSAIGGKADMGSCSAHVRFRGVKRTCLFALHVSAFDSKRTSFILSALNENRATLLPTRLAEARWELLRVPAIRGEVRMEVPAKKISRHAQPLSERQNLQTDIPLPALPRRLAMWLGEDFRASPTRPCG